MFQNQLIHKRIALFVFGLAVGLGLFSTASACDLSEYRLDSVVQNTSGTYSVYSTLCIGGGVTGTTTGADGETWTIAFGFFVGCENIPLQVPSFTPFTFQADSTNNTMVGQVAGPFSGTVNSIGYAPVFGAAWCTSSTAACGNVHQQCEQFMFEFNYVPDSIRAFGVEGTNVLAAGCYPNLDMVIDLSSFTSPIACTTDTVPPSVSCPADPTLYMGSNCMAIVPDFSVGAQGFDCCGPVTYSQSPSIGAAIATSQAGSLTVTDSAGNATTCPLFITVMDSAAPMAICPSETLYLDMSGSVTADPNVIGMGSTDNCMIQSITMSPQTFTTAQAGVNVYTLTVTDTAGNVSTCQGTVMVVDSTMVNLGLPFEDEWQIGPVPASDVLYVKGPEGLAGTTQLSVYTGVGQRVHSLKAPVGASGGRLKLSLDGLESGVYLLEIMHNGKRTVKKFVHEQ